MERPASIDLTRYEKLLDAVDAREDAVTALSDDELAAAAAAIGEPEVVRRKQKDRVLSDNQLIEICALGREAARRGLGERPFDVQLLGAMGLLAGNVIEMATGEGKTLVGAIAAAGFALGGRRVHVISVNDYLARRDAEWMAPVYQALGVAVGWVEPSRTHTERREAYAASVTYGAVSEIGFDVLRDRLAVDADQQVMQAPEVAIVDEADSVLVDEARVPLVMAGSVEPGIADEEIADIVRRLRLGKHYEMDPDRRNVWLTSDGIETVERLLGGVNLYDTTDADHLAAVNVALHAHALLTRDVDYIVRHGKVELINQSRGRVAQLQRWPDGLQAAVEAKEHVALSDRGEILDSITVQGLIAKYPLVAGMTGTAVAVAETLREFYQLEVAVIPPNTENVRIDSEDRVFATATDKVRAIVAEVGRVHAQGRPVLIGTQDVAESENLAMDLAEAGLKCTVLNARNDAEEAAIIAEAGKPGAITVSTQMAGRGTDIKLGGSTGAGADHDKSVELGGLYVIGTARYPSSRLDDQLRGRAGRQGDPGGSVYFASLEDDVVRTGAPEIPPNYTADDDGEIEAGHIAHHLDHAQRVLEGVNQEIHRNTWRYTRLIERQRGDLLAFRDKVLHENLAAELLDGAEGDEQRCREIMLYHLDQLWADHLAYLAEVRESIHLRALGKETPIDEFHRAAIPEFHKLVDSATERARLSYEKVGGDGDLAAAGVKRPTSTWTYLVQDNPFDFSVEQTLKQVRAMLSGRRL